jgi:hypothetical protein
MGDKHVCDETELGVYSIVATRQLHYNSLLWQVPVLSITAQAFLFTVALDGSSARTARIIAAVLAIATAAVSMQLMSRHRQADVSDSHWLADFEDRHFTEDLRVHGRHFKDRRDRQDAGGWLARFPYSFVIWMVALGLFGGAAMLVLVLGLIWPSVLAS